MICRRQATKVTRSGTALADLVAAQSPVPCVNAPALWATTLGRKRRVLHSCYFWRVRLPLSLVLAAVLLLPSSGSVLAENSSTDYVIPLQTLYNPCLPTDVVVGSGSVRQHVD